MREQIRRRLAGLGDCGRETRERVDLVQTVQTDFALGMLDEPTAQTVHLAQRDTDARVGAIETDLIATKMMAREVKLSLEAAEVEFALTDCGTRSWGSSVSDAEVGLVASDAGADMPGEAILLGEQGATGAGSSGEADETMAGDTVGEMVVKEFFAMVSMAAENGGFVPICGGQTPADTGRHRQTVADTGRHCQRHWGDIMMR